MIENKWFQKTIRFPEEFKDTYEQFEEIIKLDPEIKDKATQRQISNGFESLGLRTAIKFYVECNLHLLIEKMYPHLKGGQKPTQINEEKKDPSNG